MSSASKLAVAGLLATLVIVGVTMPRATSVAPPHVIVLPPMHVSSAKIPHASGELWVCAETDNLPFSDARQRGFENRIATLVAESLGRRLRYEWQPPLAGATRSALTSGDCDLVVGIPSALRSDDQSMTIPYYRSSYVFVTRADRRPVRSFDDPRLHQMTIGIQLSGDEMSPPARALASRALAAQVRGFVGSNGIASDVPQRMPVDEVASGALDAAALWGPVAGYYAARQRVPLSLTAVEDASGSDHLPFAFDIAMAVHEGNSPLVDRLNQVLREHRAGITALLREYHVPLVAATSRQAGKEGEELRP